MEFLQQNGIFSSRMTGFEFYYSIEHDAQNRMECSLQNGMF